MLFVSGEMEEKFGDILSSLFFSLSHLMPFLFRLIALKNQFSMLSEECSSKVFFPPKVCLDRLCKLLSEVLYAEIKQDDSCFWRKLKFMSLTFSYRSFSSLPIPNLPTTQELATIFFYKTFLNYQVPIPFLMYEIAIN